MKRTELSQYPPVLTLYDLAAILQVEYQTAKKIVKSGAIASFKVGKQYRIYKYALLDYCGVMKNGKIKK